MRDITNFVPIFHQFIMKHIVGALILCLF